MSSTSNYFNRAKQSSGVSFEAIEERDEIIKIATQKSKDNTLTLEESNRLLAQFNETLRAIAEQRKVVEEVDESWALELLEECGDDDEVIVA